MLSAKPRDASGKYTPTKSKILTASDKGRKETMDDGANANGVGSQGISITDGAALAKGKGKEKMPAVRMAFGQFISVRNAQGSGSGVQKGALPQQPCGQLASFTQPTLLPPVNLVPGTEPGDEPIEEPVLTQDHIVAVRKLVHGPSINQQMMGLGPSPTNKPAASKGGSWRSPQFRVGKQGPPTHNLHSKRDVGKKK